MSERKIARGDGLPTPDYDGVEDPPELRHKRRMEARLLSRDLGQSPPVEDEEELDNPLDVEEEDQLEVRPAVVPKGTRPSVRQTLQQLGQTIRQLPGQQLQLSTQDASFSMNVLAFQENQTSVAFMVPEQYSADFKIGAEVQIQVGGRTIPVISVGGKVLLDHLGMYVFCFLINREEQSE